MSLCVMILEASVGYECRFPFVAFLDPDIVESTADVKLGKELAPFPLVY